METVRPFRTVDLSVFCEAVARWNFTRSLKFQRLSGGLPKFQTEHQLINIDHGAAFRRDPTKIYLNPTFCGRIEV